jgi:hypothetical protein
MMSSTTAWLRRVPQVAFCLAVVSVPLSGLAQSLPTGCSKHLIEISADLDHRYQLRSGGRYCDGTVPVKNAGRLEVVSFTLGPIVFPASGSVLLVRRLPVGNDGSLLLTGGDKRPQTSYRLDGNMTGGEFSIDLDAAIRPKGIGAEQFGLFASRQTATGLTYIPVSAGTAPERADAALLVLRASTALVQAARQVCTGNGGCGPMEPIPGSVNLMSGGSIEIRLPVTDSIQELSIKLVTVGPGNSMDGDVIDAVIPAKR